MAATVMVAPGSGGGTDVSGRAVDMVGMGCGGGGEVGREVVVAVVFARGVVTGGVLRVGEEVANIGSGTEGGVPALCGISSSNGSSSPSPFPFELLPLSFLLCTLPPPNKLRLLELPLNFKPPSKEPEKVRGLVPPLLAESPSKGSTGAGGGTYRIIQLSIPRSVFLIR
jgi:hypothetical protein